MGYLLISQAFYDQILYQQIYADLSVTMRRAYDKKNIPRTAFCCQIFGPTSSCVYEFCAKQMPATGSILAKGWWNILLSILETFH